MLGLRHYRRTRWCRSDAGLGQTMGLARSVFVPKTIPGSAKTESARTIGEAVYHEDGSEECWMTSLGVRKRRQQRFGEFGTMRDVGEGRDGQLQMMWSSKLDSRDPRLATECPVEWIASEVLGTVVELLADRTRIVETKATNLH